MRKAILLTAAAAFLAVPAVVHGQETDNTSVTASAVIEALLEFNALESNIEFGDVTGGAEATVDPSNGANLEIKRNVGFTWRFEGGTLVHTEEGNDTSIPVRFDCSLNSGQTVSCDQLQPQSAPSGTITDVLRIGGFLSENDTDVAPGRYEGTLVITITED
jgi:spore coat protein U-like protein